MKFYKTNRTNRILVIHPGSGYHSILLATPTEKQEFNVGLQTLEEVNLEDIKYLYPHFEKNLKNILFSQN